MKSIIKKLQKTILIEENKSTNLKSVEEFDDILSQLNKFNLNQKPNYTLPTIDTIGKSTYTILNKRII